MRSASDQYNDESDEPRMSSSISKKHSDKSKQKVRSTYVLSSSEEDQSSVARHRSSKPSGAHPSVAISDQDQPHHDPDPPCYREVALPDVPSQYGEEVDTFRCILSLPDPRESMPGSSTSVMGLEDEKVIKSSDLEVLPLCFHSAQLSNRAISTEFLIRRGVQEGLLQKGKISIFATFGDHLGLLRKMKKCEYLENCTR